MIERRDRTRFTVKPLAELRVGGEMRRQHLDRDRAIQARVAGLVDLAHPAGVTRIPILVMTPDGRSYAYVLPRELSDLYRVGGLE